MYFYNTFFSHKITFITNNDILTHLYEINSNKNSHVYSRINSTLITTREIVLLM